MEILKKGSRGDSVKTLQRLLGTKGYGLEPDGIFGALTEEAVKAFQASVGLEPDGIVGEKTMSKILSKLKRANRKITGIFLHCSATREGVPVSVDVIRSWHKAQGWSDIGYHYVIGLDGMVNVGRDVNKVGSHCAGHNASTIGVCYIGGCASDGKTPKDTRTAEQKAALVSLVSELMSMYGLPASAVHCHNEYAAKACPSFSIAEFRKELQG